MGYNVIRGTVVKAGLTGRRRVRRGWFGKLILQVEVGYDRIDGIDPGEREYNVQQEWCDATAADVDIEFGRIDSAIQIAP